MLNRVMMPGLIDVRAWEKTVHLPHAKLSLRRFDGRRQRCRGPAFTEYRRMEPEPDSKSPKATDDRRQLLTESRAHAVDALQVKLFAKALVNLGLAQYSPLASERTRSR